LEQHYELLAHHWELSDNPDRALEYLVLAGEKANQSQAANAAVEFFTRALKRIEKLEKATDPQLMLRIREGRATPLHAMGRIEESMEDNNDAMRIAHELGNQQMVLNCLAKTLNLVGTTLKDKVPEYCERGLELARILEDKSAEARFTVYCAYWRYAWQGTDEYETFQHALKLAEESGQPLAIFFVRGLFSAMERWNGNTQRSLELGEGLVEMAQSIYNIYFASHVSFFRGMALTDVGRYNEAIQFLGEWIDIFEKNEINIAVVKCYNTLGWAHSEIYDLNNAFKFNNRALDSVVPLQKSPAMLFSTSEMQAMSEVNLMENEFEMGKLDQAWAHITRFEDISASSNYDYHRIRWSTRMKDLRGRILLRRGELDGAEEIAQQCLAAALNRDMKKYVGRAERLLGRTLTARGAFDQAEEHLRTALIKLEEVNNPKQIWLTRTALARLYDKMKKSDLKREQWQAARAIVESTADGLHDSQLRMNFNNAAPVREILENASR
jgi:tetratricopeptide (TPR) repeat protein